MAIHGSRTLIVAATMLTVIAASSGGCSVGPQTLSRDRFDYGQSLAQSAREQLLMNIVRIRYLESPMFTSVTSVVNQYSLEGTLAADAGWNWGSPSGSGIGVGAGGRFADRPTITYAPMVGPQFTKSILTPMRPEAVLALIESGWKVNSLFPLTVHSINGIRNRFFAGASTQALDPRFGQIVELMAQMQEDGTVSIRVIDSGNEMTPSFVMMISGADSDAERQKIAELKELLGLDLSTDRYKIVFGAAARDATEIAIVTRSILAILADMSSYVRVPVEHITEGRATPGAPLDDGMRHPLAVHCSEVEPEDSYVRIRHRDLWYSIDDRDLNSKRTFSILQLLSTLAESPDAAQTPLLTIPAG